MTTKKIEITDTVALTIDLIEEGLIMGQVGTVVEILGPDNNVYEVEFCDTEGRTKVQLTVQERFLMKLHFDLA